MQSTNSTNNDTTPLVENVLSDKEYNSLKAQAANYRTILRLLKSSGIDSFLEERRLLPIDLELAPEDLNGGTSVNLFLKSIADECNRMDQKITSLSQALVDNAILLAKEKRRSERKSPFLWIKEKINNLVLFVSTLTTRS